MADFIPRPDDAFNHFITLLGSVITDAANPLKIPGNLVAEWTPAAAAWNTAFTAWEDLAPEVKSALEAKDAARAVLEPIARAANNAAQANTTLTDAERAAAGLPVHKTHRTPVGVPQTAPMIVKLDNEHLLQRVHFADSATPGSKAKPAGVALCEIRQLVQPAATPAPTDPAALPLLALDSRTPHRTDFDASDVGQKAYYVLRWLNGKGEQGPWGEITGYPVL